MTSPRRLPEVLIIGLVRHSLLPRTHTGVTLEGEWHLFLKTALGWRGEGAWEALGALGLVLQIIFSVIPKVALYRLVVYILITCLFDLFHYISTDNFIFLAGVSQSIVFMAWVYT